MNRKSVLVLTLCVFGVGSSWVGMFWQEINMVIDFGVGWGREELDCDDFMHVCVYGGRRGRSRK